MKKSITLILFAAVVIISSCSKSDNPAPSEKYMSTSANSTWNYMYTDNLSAGNSHAYTLTSTSRDSAAGTRTYHVFTRSDNTPNEYFAISSSNYYSFQSLPAALGSTKIENLYLQDNAAVNTSWTQSFSIVYSGVPITVEVTNKVTEKGITKLVNGVTYNDVIHVVTTFAVPGLPAGTITLSTNINYYYARKYGMIANDILIDAVILGTPTNTSTKTELLTATIL